MSVFFFWGNDDFRLHKAVISLRDRTLDPAWASFNADKISSEPADAVIQALNQALTPPFGSGQRFVWLENTTLGQRCSEALLKELERTLPIIPEQTVFLLTSEAKPDGRLKSTKLLQKYANIQEFSAISPWKADEILQQVRQVAQEIGLPLQPAAAELLAVAIGADTRRLYTELEKLSIYWHGQSQPLSPEVVDSLVTTNTQNSLQLAVALRAADVGRSLELITDLLNRNEPALRIMATLVGQFRTWLWVKVLTEAGVRDPKAIAQAAEISNPKRVYFLQKEVHGLSIRQLKQVLNCLLVLEFELKRGVPEAIALPTKMIEIAHCFERV